MKKFYFSLFLFLGLVSKVAEAQDPIYSQFFYHEVYYNPALTGINNGLRGVLSGRKFWTAVPGLNTSNYASAEYIDRFFYNFGGSIIIQNWARGDNFMVTNKASLAFAKRLYLGGVQFQVGGGFGFINNAVNYSNLHFSDEYDARLGRVYPTEFVPGISSKISFDAFDLGIVSRFNIMKTSTKAIATNTFGIAVHHLGRPARLGFLANSVERVPLKLTLHWYSFFRIDRSGFYNSHFYLAPGLLFEKQKLGKLFWKKNESGFKTLSFGCNAIVPTRVSFISQLNLGLWVRKQFYKKVALADVKDKINSKQFDALVYTLGIVKHSKNGKENWRVLYSYDMTISSAAMGGYTGGTHEIIVAFEIHDLAIPGGGRNWGYVKNPADKFFHMGTGR